MKLNVICIKLHKNRKILTFEVVYKPIFRSSFPLLAITELRWIILSCMFLI